MLILSSYDLTGEEPEVTAHESRIEALAALGSICMALADGIVGLFIRAMRSE